jgi:uncharacterized membrane protein YgcG
MWMHCWAPMGLVVLAALTICRCACFPQPRERLCIFVGGKQHAALIAVVWPQADIQTSHRQLHLSDLQQALQGLPGMLGSDGMGFNAGLQPMQQGGYPQAPPPRIGRSSMDTAGTNSPTHSGLVGAVVSSGPHNEKHLPCPARICPDDTYTSDCCTTCTAMAMPANPSNLVCLSSSLLRLSLLSARYTVDMEGQRHGRRGSVELPGGGRAMSPTASGGGGSAGGVSHGGGGGGSVTSGLDANAGPRIFVGKLNRATTEADVREYFTRCASRACNPDSALFCHATCFQVQHMAACCL